MFPKRVRLTKSDHIKKVMRTGYMKRGAHLSVLALPQKQLQMTVIVGATVSKSAVARNALKRRIRAAVRNCKNVLRPAAIVVIAKPGSAKATTHDLTTELSHLFVSLFRS